MEYCNGRFERLSKPECPRAIPGEGVKMGSESGQSWPGLLAREELL